MLFFGDISTWNIHNFSVGKIDPAILKKISTEDTVIFNLEGPIVRSGKSYRFQIRRNRLGDRFLQSLLGITGNKQPIVFSTEDILALLTLNQNTIVCMANNHIKDCGYEGYRDTINLLNEHNIRILGVGDNQEEACEPVRIGNTTLFNINYVASTKYGLKVLLYNATRKDYGAAFLTFEKLFKVVNGEHDNNKKVVLILHAGKENSTLETLGIDLEKVKEIGADLTILHHPHHYIRTPFEESNIFVIGDFIFNRPGKLRPDRATAYIEYVQETSVTKITRHNVDKLYDNR